VYVTFDVKREITLMNGKTGPILRSKDLTYQYPGQPPISFPDIACEHGAHLLLTGNSGVGKTTLLHLLSGLLQVQEGVVEIDGVNIAALNQKELDKFRGSHVGLVFQQPRFVASLTVLDNILAAQYFGRGKSNIASAMDLLEELGISDKTTRMTHALSGGERQRLAIARAIAASPSVIYADEPTSSLDDVNAMMVYDLLVKEAGKSGATLVVVTHDQRLKPMFNNQVAL
jgi:putative ABC transport system ATP-binding protein